VHALLTHEVENIEHPLAEEKEEGVQNQVVREEDSF